MVLEQNIKYKATVSLTWLERKFASNQVISKKLTDAGFKDVLVFASGSNVTAVGIWNRVNAELSSMLTGKGVEVLKRAKIEKV